MTDEMIQVPRRELLAWAKAWESAYGPGDGTDCVTPFDKYLYGTSYRITVDPDTGVVTGAREKQRCTCPSGDGSLRWPCPAHPPEAQAQAQAQGGGDVFGWVLGDAFVDARYWTADAPPLGWTPVYCTAPPSAPVGVEESLDRLRQHRSQRLWQADLVGGGISVERMRAILHVALAAQSGGSDNE